MSEAIYGWVSSEEGQDTLSAGDLSNSDICARYLHQINLEEYYKSERFAVGYSELQTMWSMRNKDNDNSPALSISSGLDAFPYGSKTKFDASERKRTMVLPLEDTLSTSSASCTQLEVPPLGHSPRRWSSSVGASPLGTPSPLMSDAPSPIRSPPSGTLTSSPLLSGRQKLHLTTFQQTRCTLPPECYERGENLDRDHEEPPKTGKPRSSLLDGFRRIIGQFRGRKTESCTRLSTDCQIAELETELESYRQLSESKRRAADLLKHQLMEVLYEKVVSEVEERHKRRHLEEEMMSLEFELHILRSNTEESIRTLTQQLQRVITEKRVLQRQVNYRNLDDRLPDYFHLFCPRQIKICGIDGAPRRASH
ncbi:uncharacterized protein [Macrobrachium rosenbergii]|uniref:uncharacterized protein isoform X2 n=1 Tax=Macrobrachium rosenbergii TaxID=79674 RepID=UPI0034D567D4